MLSIAKNPYAKLLANGAYALWNCITGFYINSWWFITVGAYYVTLSVARFSVLQIDRKSNGSPRVGIFAKRITGILLVILSSCLIGVVILSAIKDRGIVFHEIVMIAIATYSFAKITLAIIGMIKARKSNSPIMLTLRNIALADSFVSIYTLQRSMLVSFPGLTAGEIQLFNILTGTGVWIIVLFLGINLIGGDHTDMAKSKIVKATEKMATAVTAGYEKIEKTVVSGYTKIEDKFVDAYLTKGGETVEEAKKRLKEHK